MSSPDHTAWYRREFWLVPSLLAFVPIGAAMVVRKPLQTILVWVAVVLLVLGFALLTRRSVSAASSSEIERS